MYQEERQEWCWEKKQAQVAQKRKGKVNSSLIIII